jgi:hypothetical protein
MAETVTKRQFITDAEGNRIAVILPMDEFALVKDVLERKTQALNEADKLAEMEQAAQDPLFLTDLCETMSAFSEVDAEWWESPE